MTLFGTSFSSSVATVLGFALINAVVDGYVLPHAGVSVGYHLSRHRPLHSKLFGPEGDFDHNIGNIGDSAMEGGDDLVKNFFKEVRKREEIPQSTESSFQTDDEDDIIFRIQNPNPGAATPSTGRIPKTDPNAPTNESPTKKKFTGQESFYAPRSSASSSNTGSSSSQTQGLTPREMMMQREYELVGRAERGIVVQAMIAVTALIFYIYIGLSGGIVTGPDAQLENFGGDDEIPFEQVMPVQRDREISVWL